MSIKTALKNGTSRFLHLSSIPRAASTAAAPAPKPRASAEDEQDKDKDKDKDKNAAAPKTDGEDASASAAKTEDEECDDDDDDDAEAGDEEVKKAQANGQGPALSAAARRERRRCSAIFASQHAQGRIPLACELAFGTDMKADAAIRVLSASAKEDAKNPLAAALAGVDRIDIGTDAAAKKPGAQSPDDQLMAAAEARVKSKAKA